MAIYAISDLHGQIPAGKPDDMTSLIVVGDICPDYIRTRWDAHYRERTIDGHQHQAKWLDVRFREWAAFLDVPIYATFGNHDFIGEKPFLWPVISYVQFAVDDWCSSRATRSGSTPTRLACRLGAEGGVPGGHGEARQGA
jgi:hypothetical protein